MLHRNFFFVSFFSCVKKQLIRCSLHHNGFLIIILAISFKNSSIISNKYNRCIFQKKAVVF